MMQKFQRPKWMLPQVKRVAYPIMNKGNAYRRLVIVETKDGPRSYHVTKGWRS